MKNTQNEKISQIKISTLLVDDEGHRGSEATASRADGRRR
jgi:hypothetical protein